MDHNRKALSMWDGWSRGRRGIPVYDPWLAEYEKILDRADVDEVLDLGCGIGANTQYLIEHGHSVISADYSGEALKNIDDNIPNSKTVYVDMNEAFPFEDKTFSVVIGDISLHYFNDKKTIHVMKEIKRILKPGGYLLARVSSMNDTYYGAGSGREIEPHYYNHDLRVKR